MGALTMENPTHTDRLNAARRVVVKVGSALLVDQESGALREDWLQSLVSDLAAMRERGTRIAVVSSGAIALGRAILGLGPDPALEEAQAAAAVGQQRLARAWEEAFSAHGCATAQILLTLSDTQNRRRYLNGRATMETLMRLGAIPVVNENDTVATDEIRYGDNDRLAARVALMAGADLMILLSDIDGFYTANPKHDSEARHIPEIGEITSEIEAMAGESDNASARGGMRTKLVAAKTAMQGGCTMAVTLGTEAHPIRRLMEGGRATWFPAMATPQVARKNWISGMKPVGTIHVDAGAVTALRSGKSLLPAGVTGVDGAFERGDPVAITGPDGTVVGAALAGYRAAEARAIAGKRSSEIAECLGYPGRSALAHRDDMVIWGT
ncbi:MAG: glutamate 5-kinase [Pseudomonadota bacterium]